MYRIINSNSNAILDIDGITEYPSELAARSAIQRIQHNSIFHSNQNYVIKKIEKLSTIDTSINFDNLFKLSQTEIQTLSDWKTQHSKICKIGEGLNNLSSIQFIFNLGSVGVSCIAKCTECGEDVDITDYLNW